MKILAFSDLHAHNWPEFSKVGPDGVNTRLAQCVRVIEDIRERALDEEASWVLFGGDLFHVKRLVPVQVLHYVHHAISRLAEVARVVLVVGNHDQATQSGVHSAFAFSRASNIKVVDTPQWVDLGSSVAVLGVPYMEDHVAFKKALATPPPKRFKRRLLLAHGAINGAKTGPVEYQPPHSLQPGDIPDDFDLRLFGHYHQRQKLAHNLWYIGSPLQHTRGEARDRKKGYVLHDTHDGSLVLCPTNAPQFVNIKVEGASYFQDGEPITDLYAAVHGNFVDVGVDVETRDLAAVVEELTAMGPAGLYALPLAPPAPKKVETRLKVVPGMGIAQAAERYVEKYATADLKPKLLNRIIKEVLHNG